MELVFPGLNVDVSGQGDFHQCLMFFAQHNATVTALVLAAQFASRPVLVGGFDFVKAAFFAFFLMPSTKT
jgi:hypothetical protein